MFNYAVKVVMAEVVKRLEIIEGCRLRVRVGLVG